MFGCLSIGIRVGCSLLELEIWEDYVNDMS